MAQLLHYKLEKKHIFLSYRSSEVDFALRLAVDLKNAGVNLWMDRLDIAPGDDWLKMLQKAVNECAAMISVLSPEYVNSKYCQRELARADRLGRIIFPVLLAPISEADWPLEVERQQYSDFIKWREDKSYNDQLQKLITIIRERLVDQVSSIPDPETRYINTLIAELEASRGIVEYFEPSSPVGSFTGEEVVRPQPIFVKTWNMRGRYALVNEPTSENGLSSNGTSKSVILNGIYEAVESHPRVVLLGGPGSGKTTTLEHLVLDAAHQYRTTPNVAPLPIYLKLVNWEDESSPADFVRSHWPLDSDPIKLLNKGKVALYLDGLNEMGNDGPAKVKLLRKWLQGQTAPQRVVLTCRESDYDESMNLHLPVVRTIDLDRSHIQQFVRNYLGEDDARIFLSQVLLDLDHSRPISSHLYEMARNPFLLSALIVVYKLSPDHEILRNAGALIQKLVAELWSRGRKQPGAEKIPFKRLETALVDLAFALIDSDIPVFVSRDYAMEYISSHSLLNAAVAANLLEVQGKNVRFSNQLIQEYFAALGLMRTGLSTRLSKPHFNAAIQRIPSKWDMVIQILTGLAPDPEPVILEIARIDPYLALQCTLKAVRVSDKTYQAVVELLLANMEGDRRVAMASIFIGLDDEKALLTLLEVMRDGAWPIRLAAANALKNISIVLLPGLTQAIDELEEKTRETTLTALRQLGQDAIPTLLQLLRDSNWHRRRGAAWALAELRDKAAVPLLLDLLQDSDHLVSADAAIALGRIKDSVAVPGLVLALGHENWRVGKAASRALAGIGKPSISNLLEVITSSGSQVRQQIRAIEALAQINDEAATQALLNATHSKNVDIRSAAIEGLRQHRSEEVVKRLTECLSDTARPRQGKQRICDMAAEILETMGVKGNSTPTDTYKNDPRLQTGTTAISSTAKGGRERLEQDKDNSSNSADNRDIIEALKDADWIVRRDAVLTLTTLSPAVALPLLVSALKDDDSQVRLAAVNTLAVLKNETGVLPALVQALSDEEYIVSDAAKEAIKKIAKPPAPEIRDLLHSHNTNTRGAAIEILGSIQETDAVKEIIDALSDVSRSWLSDKRICDISAQALEAIGTAEAIEAVKQWSKIKGTLPPPVQTGTHKAVDPEAASTKQHKDILSELLNALHDEDWEKQQIAAKSLREYAQLQRGSADPDTVDRLCKALNDPDSNVRWAVTEALAWIGSRAAVPMITPLLKDPNWTVKIAAIRALVEINDPSAVDRLISVLADKSGMVREAATEALGVLGDRRAVPALLQAILDPESFVRLAAIDALGKIKDPEAVLPLMNTLYDKNPDIRWFAVSALGRIGSPEACLDLIECLNDTATLSWDEKRICDIASEALEAIGTPEAKAAVAEWRRSQAGSQ